MRDPDVQLMLRVREDDQEAFAELVGRHSTRLLRYFIVQSGDHALAEDLSQEAWAKVFRARSDYRPDAKFTTFLYRVARNLWIDWYRSAASRPAAAAGQGDDDGEELPEPVHWAAGETSERVSGRLEREDLRGLLVRAVRALPPEMRQVFELAEFFDTPYAQIAERLGVPVGTIKSRMWHAYRRLREFLGPDFPELSG